MHIENFLAAILTSFGFHGATVQRIGDPSDSAGPLIKINFVEKDCYNLFFTKGDHLECKLGDVVKQINGNEYIRCCPITVKNLDVTIENKYDSRFTVNYRSEREVRLTDDALKPVSDAYPTYAQGWWDNDMAIFGDHDYHFRDYSKEPVEDFKTSNLQQVRKWVTGLFNRETTTSKELRNSKYICGVDTNPRGDKIVQYCWFSQLLDVSMYDSGALARNKVCGEQEALKVITDCSDRATASHHDKWGDYCFTPTGGCGKINVKDNSNIEKCKLLLQYPAFKELYHFQCAMVDLNSCLCEQCNDGYYFHVESLTCQRIPDCDLGHHFDAATSLSDTGEKAALDMENNPFKYNCIYNHTCGNGYYHDQTTNECTFNSTCGIGHYYDARNNICEFNTTCAELGDGMYHDHETGKCITCDVGYMFGVKIQLENNKSDAVCSLNTTCPLGHYYDQYEEACLFNYTCGVYRYFDQKETLTCMTNNTLVELDAQKKQNEQEILKEAQEFAQNPGTKVPMQPEPTYDPNGPPQSEPQDDTGAGFADVKGSNNDDPFTVSAQSVGGDDDPSSSSNLGAGIIAGIVIAVLAVIAGIGALIFLSKKKRKGSKFDGIMNPNTHSDTSSTHDEYPVNYNLGDRPTDFEMKISPRNSDVDEMEADVIARL